MKLKVLTYIFLAWQFAQVSAQTKTSFDDINSNRPVTKFLSVEEGREAILDETYEPYFSKLQKRELVTFTQKLVPFDSPDSIRKEARKRFSSAVMAFDQDEKEALSWYCDTINSLLNKAGLGLMARQAWCFIKIEPWLCGGFSHTRGICIIFSEPVVNGLTDLYSQGRKSGDFTRALQRGGSLLVHEQLHVLQRLYPERFYRLNHDIWGFVQAEVEDCPAILIDQLSNPDAPRPEWLIPSENKMCHFYWVRTMLRKGPEIPVMGKDFLDVVYEVKKDGDTYEVVRDKDGDPVSFPVSEFTSYTDRFPVSRGIDHPNEIAAYMFARYFVHELLLNDFEASLSPKELEQFEPFVTWCYEELR